MIILIKAEITVLHNQKVEHTTVLKKMAGYFSKR